MNEIINITKSAEEYLSKLIQDKNETDLSIRIFISDPGTPKAETCLAYCKPDEAMPDDLIINLELINVNLEKRSIPFLKDCAISLFCFSVSLLAKFYFSNLYKFYSKSQKKIDINIKKIYKYIVFIFDNLLVESAGLF